VCFTYFTFISSIYLFKKTVFEFMPFRKIQICMVDNNSLLKYLLSPKSSPILLTIIFFCELYATGKFTFHLAITCLVFSGYDVVQPIFYYKGRTKSLPSYSKILSLKYRYKHFAIGNWTCFLYMN